MLKAVWKIEPLAFLSFLQQDTEQENVAWLCRVTANDSASENTFSPCLKLLLLKRNMHTTVHIGIGVINLTKIQLWVISLEEPQGHNYERKVEFASLHSECSSYLSGLHTRKVLFTNKKLQLNKVMPKITFCLKP